MTSIKESVDIETLATTIYVLVDDWFKANKCVRVGRKPEFSDSEVVTLVLLMDYVPFPSERQFLCYIRANHLKLFPRLLDQSQFNVRARGLRGRVEELRKHWQSSIVRELQKYLLLDTKPVPVVSYKRNKDNSDFLGSANYGYCASKAMKYYGYKLVLLSTLEGIPIVYDLVPANTDERIAAEEILEHARGTEVITDKGFIGDAWQQDMEQDFGVKVLCPKRVNQKEQNPLGFDSLIGSCRQRVEGVFNELQNVGRNLEKLMAKTVIGLASRVVALITSHILKIFLRKFYNIDIQTFSTIET